MQKNPLNGGLGISLPPVTSLAAYQISDKYGLIS